MNKSERYQENNGIQKKGNEKKGMTRIAALLAMVVLIIGMACFCAGCGESSSDAQQGTDQQTEQTLATTDEQSGGSEGDVQDRSLGGSSGKTNDSGDVEAPDRDGVYDSKEDVARYLFVYGELPKNYITKREAQALGWNGGSLERYAPGKCIGGSNFGNYERRLPKGKYRECDINTLGAKSRGPERLVYSDEAIYYTGDHYETFEQLYDKDGRL